MLKVLSYALVISLALSLEVFAEEAAKVDLKKKPAAASNETTPAEDAAEKVNVEKVKEKYWARGDESELGVVQNRLYSKARRVELGLLAGVLSSDPFLSAKAAGGTLGYHFNEYFSTHLIGWKSFSSGSSANEVLEASGKKANTNPPKAFYGAEARASLLYGKLSVVGKSIVYYDMHFLGGMGMTVTEPYPGISESYFTPFLGLGQQVFLSKYTAFNIDYRAMRYTERTREKTITSKLGQVNEARTNWTHAIVIGVSFFFGK